MTGKARVSVPDEALVRQDKPPVSPTDTPPVSPMDGPPVSPPDKLLKALEAHVETLKAQLAAAEARAEKQAVEHVVELAAEKARTEKAIAAFASLAERLDALAAERAKPWWRRLAG